MTKFDKKTFTDAQKAKNYKDRETMTYAELKAKWGGSIGGLQRVCDALSVLCLSCGAVRP
jgi:hypothetical protein